MSYWRLYNSTKVWAAVGNNKNKSDPSGNIISGFSDPLIASIESEAPHYV